MAAALITGIPASVYGDLIIPASRSSLAAEFKNGNTPAWYQALPSYAQSYIQQIALQASSANPSYAELTYVPAAAAPITVGTDVVDPTKAATKAQGPAVAATIAQAEVVVSSASATHATTSAADNTLATAFGSTAGAAAATTSKKAAAPIQTVGLTGALLGGVLAAIVAL